jgi:uncharacterized protein (TIGR02597 family)
MRLCLPSRLFSLLTRRSVFCASVLCAVVGANFAQAASVVSEPVGCVRVVIPAPANGESTWKAVGVPFNRASVFRGVVASASGSTLKVSAPGWTAGQFLRELHYLKLRSGANAGRSFEITANTADSVTLNAVGVSFAEKQLFEVFPAQTLGSLFGASQTPLRTGTSEATADLVRVHDGAKWSTYFHTGQQWQMSGGTVSQNATVIRPGQGVILVTGGSRSVSLALRGSVSITSEWTAIPASGEALLANRSPFETSLGAMKFQSLPGWVTGVSASVSDNVMSWNGTSWDVFYHNGTRWKRVGNQGSQDEAAIEAGESLLIRRVGGAREGEGYLETSAPFVYRLSN